MKKFFKHDKARAVFGLSKSILSSEHDDDSDDDDNNSKCREVNGRSKKFLLGEREQSSRLSTFQCWGGGACLSRGEEGDDDDDDDGGDDDGDDGDDGDDDGDDNDHL